MSLQGSGVLSVILVGAVWGLSGLLVVLTVLPVWDTTIWWIRAMDFPRVQIAVLAGLLFVVALFCAGPARIVVPLLMIAILGYQTWRIFPYTPLARVEVGLGAEGPDTIRLFAANVLMDNRDYAPILEEITGEDPDILLLMETDQAWIDALEPVLARYPTVLRQPRDNYYGMVFATRLAVEDARMVHLTRAGDTPTVFAELRDAAGQAFRFIGLHPRPPLPGDSTEERDAQIRFAALFAAQSGMPLIAMGDFNDVAWSDISRMFKRVGGYVDPRIGRGFYSSFDAEKWYLRFPIDQLYMTSDVAVVSFARLGPVGSDHFPMTAAVRLDAEQAARLNIEPEPMSEKEREMTEKSVAQTRAALEAAGHRLP